MDLAIRLQASSGKVQELSQTLLALVDTMRTAHGCQDCHLYLDLENSETFYLASQWEGNTALEQYMRSESGGAILGAIALLGETAQIRICKKTPWLGIEALKQMRTGS